MLVSWAPLAAHTAALVEEILARPYVRITPLLGVGRWHRFTGYVLPALVGPVTRHALVRFPGITLALTALGFLGLGQQPPYPEWGLIVAEGIYRTCPLGGTGPDYHTDAAGNVGGLVGANDLWCEEGKVTASLKIMYQILCPGTP